MELLNGALIVIPVAKIGINVVTKTYKDIHDQDVCILLDKEAFNQSSKKIFSKQSFLQKVWTIIKTGTKNLIVESIAAIPLILKCVAGYAVCTGFQQAIENPKALATSAQEIAQKYADKALKEIGEKGKYLTLEDALEIINRNYKEGVSAGAAPELLRQLLNTIEDNTKVQVGKWAGASAAGARRSETNHGQVDLMDGSRTTVDDNGKFVKEKVSSTEYAAALDKLTGVYGNTLAPFAF